MYSVLILWAPDTAENRRVVDAVSRAFDEEKNPAVSKTVSASTIADITASDIVIFGTEKVGSAEVPPDYSECLRVFKGIALAGRTAAFFSLGPEKATTRLRRALKDTEITQRDEDPLFAESRPGEIADWARRVLAAHRDMKNARA
jgi:hypothetical protein